MKFFRFNFPLHPQRCIWPHLKRIYHEVYRKKLWMFTCLRTADEYQLQLVTWVKGDLKRTHSRTFVFIFKFQPIQHLTVFYELFLISKEKRIRNYIGTFLKHLEAFRFCKDSLQCYNNTMKSSFSLKI